MKYVLKRTREILY